MYRLKEIQDKLLNVVGWQQAYNPAKAINTDLTQTESGLFFQGAHPLLTLDNIEAILPEEYLYQYPAYVAGTPYMTSDKVLFNGKVFISKINNNLIEPSESAPEWKLYNFLSDYLEQETRNGIATMLQKFIADKTIAKATKTLLERQTFFEGSGRLAATIDNKGKICGFEIDLVRSMGVTAKIERIGLQFTGGTGTVRIYVFNSNMIEAFKVIDLEYTVENGGFQWFNIEELYLSYISETTNSGGSWYICYNQNDLPEGMEAITVSKDWNREPCSGCNIGNVHAWRELVKYLNISPFTFDAPTDFIDFPERWNLSKNIYTNTFNYGMNVEVSVGCDLTDFITSQRGIFANVIQKQVAANLLRTMALNPDVRVNRNQSNVSRMDMLYEIDGNTNSYRPGGLGHELKKFYEALNIDTIGLDRVCLACATKGVRYRTT